MQNTARLTINLDPADLDRLNAVADAAEISASTLVRWAVRFVCRNQDLFVPGVHGTIMRSNSDENAEQVA